MKNILLFVWLFLILAAMQLSHDSVLGNLKYLNDKDDLQNVRRLLKHGENYSGLIYNQNLPYIGGQNHMTFSLLTKYYIEGVGVIPRWTKMHHEISNWYDSVLNEEQYNKKRSFENLNSNHETQ
jgi:hypothetical protein